MVIPRYLIAVSVFLTTRPSLITATAAPSGSESHDLGREQQWVPVCADRAGAYGRTSEAIGEFVKRTFLADLRSGATVDRHLADQLVPFAALAHGRSRYVVRQVTNHVLSNVWLVAVNSARR